MRKHYFLYPILMICLLGCSTSLVKDIRVDGTKLPKIFEGEDEKGFYLNTFTFGYKYVDVNEDNAFILHKDGYIKSIDSIPYSNLLLPVSALSIEACYLNNETNEEYDLKEVEYEETDGGFVYNLKGYQRVIVLNNTAQDITIDSLYFFAEN